MKDRYYGKNDPVAQKILNKAKTTLSPLTPPADPSIVSKSLVYSYEITHIYHRHHYLLVILMILLQK
jgi:hypothetical protein